jgi:hypothetical protein
MIIANGNRGSASMDQNIAILFAPWGLILGGGLIALSGLSLFRVHFFESKWIAIGAFLLGVAILASMEIIWFAGNGFYFFENQKLTANTCYFDAEAAFSRASGVKNNDITDDVAKFVGACMNKAGYEWVPGHHKCSVFPFATNAYCYRPYAFFNNTLTNLQLLWE